MEYTSKKIGRLMAMTMLAASAMQAGDIAFQVRHEHLRNGCTGILTVDERGLRFAGGKGHAWEWAYADIEELKLSPASIHLDTYTGRTFEFAGKIPAGVYALWKGRLDRRFVAELADSRVQPLLEIPAKHLGRLRSSQGTLEVGADRIVYKTSAPDDCRTWRLADIENISSTGPFDLTITTPEKEFRFQLKQVLSETKYNELWRRVYDTRGRTE